MLLWTFDRLLEALLPSLAQNMGVREEGGIHSDFYATSWFLTIFAADLAAGIGNGISSEGSQNYYYRGKVFVEFAQKSTRQN